MNREEQIRNLETEWAESPRWKGIRRDYSAADVVKLRGSVQIEYTLARRGAERLWNGVHEDEPLCALGALTGNQAIQEVQAGLRAIYCSGWQVAGDGNSAGEMYPDQSLYPVDSVPKMVERINNAFIRTDEIHSLNGDDTIDWFAPIVADAEARTAERAEGGAPDWTPPTGLPDVYIGMGDTAENVAEIEKVSREEMDEFACQSQNRAVDARENGFFEREMEFRQTMGYPPATALVNVIIRSRDAGAGAECYTCRTAEDAEYSPEVAVDDRTPGDRV